jgi:hypothetical protein
MIMANYASKQGLHVVKIFNRVANGGKVICGQSAGFEPAVFCFQSKRIILL